MNAWLKVAIKTSDVTKLKSLLTQCYQVLQKLDKFCKTQEKILSITKFSVYFLG